MSVPIWLFWDGRKPPIIDLCLESILKYNTSPDFEIRVLDMNNVIEYVPQELVDKIKSRFIKIQHFADILRIYLLKTYGGIWLDMDILFFKSLKPLIKYLEEYEYIGFGFTGPKGFYKYGYPSNWCIICKKNSLLFNWIWHKLIEPKLIDEEEEEDKEVDYHAYGKLLIWNALSELTPRGYKYLHLPTCYDGTRDYKGEWVSMQRLEKKANNEIIYPAEFDKHRIFLVLYHSEMSNEFKQLTKEQLMTGLFTLTKFLNQSLN